MANYTEHVPLKGSERVAVSGAKPIGAANPDESLQVTVLLRSRSQAEDAKTNTNKATVNEKAAVESLLQKRAADRQHLTPEQFLAQRGALQEDILKVEEFAHEYGLSISDTNLAKGSVTLSGTVAQFGKAFNSEAPLSYPPPGDNFPRANHPARWHLHPSPSCPTLRLPLGGQWHRPMHRHYRIGRRLQSPRHQDLLQKHLEYDCPKSCGYLCRQRPQQTHR